jgi:hypothetical protein
MNNVLNEKGIIQNLLFPRFFNTRQHFVSSISLASKFATLFCPFSFNFQYLNGTYFLKLFGTVLIKEYYQIKIYILCFFLVFKMSASKSSIKKRLLLRSSCW